MAWRPGVLSPGAKLPNSNDFEASAYSDKLWMACFGFNPCAFGREHAFPTINHKE
jgi:hypothetical protein